ncbi:MAG TPA: cytochrome c [Solirubrobacterales bacterium]|nr:cytochrome c [Solirubrobacterales bacterium]
MNDTVFYVLGLSLVAIALIVSFVGLRWEKFPSSRALLVGGTVAIAALVAATAVFAWRNAEDEQEHREHELAEASEENAAEGDELEAAEEVGSGVAEETTTTSTAGGADTATIDQGSQVFASAGCTGCHTLADAGSNGTTGPDLDGALKGKPESFIRTSIVDPNAEIEQNYPPNVMPDNYGTELSPEDLDALVAYLHQATAGGG